MNKKNISIRLKLIISFTLVCMILIISVGLLFLKSNNTAVVDSKKKELNTLAEETGNKIERFLFERYGDVQVMSASPVLTRQDISDNIKLEYIESVRKAYKVYDYILTTDTKGNIRNLSGEINGDTNYRKWINYALNDKIFVSDIIYLAKNKSYVMYMIAPLKDINGQIEGTVVERVDFEAIYNIVRNVKFGESGHAYLESQEGDTILNENEHDNKKIAFGSVENEIYYRTYNNTKLVYAYYPLMKYDTQKSTWYLIIEQPEKNAFELSNSLRNYTIFVILISISAICVLAFITSERITTPFNTINTNLRFMEQKVIKISDELQKSTMRAKNLEALATMSAGMAHEVRNPLTSIKGYAQYIKLELGNENGLQEDVDVIIDEVDRLNRILDRFLSFARPKELSLKPENINELVKEVLKIVKKEMNKRDVRLHASLNSIPEVLVDHDQIQQVLFNIITNSIQAMHSGGILSISTGYTKKLNMVCLEISDTGVGIKAEDQDKIFDPFFTTKEKGVGLGLSICSRIIENHKGFIEVESSLGKGTKFIIKFPIQEV